VLYLAIVAPARADFREFKQLPVDAKLEKRLAPYKGAKRSIRFSLDEPIPLDLIDALVKIRVKENLASAAAKEKARPARRTGGATKVASKIVSKRRRASPRRAK